MFLVIDWLLFAVDIFNISDGLAACCLFDSLAHRDIVISHKANPPAR
jgi:hypothetical protein